MATLKFEFIGWKLEGTSDKIWGWFSLGDGYYRFWGARGKKVQFKKELRRWELQNIEGQKLNKGYDQVSEKKLLDIWPTFHNDVESRLTYSILANKIK